MDFCKYHILGWEGGEVKEPTYLNRFTNYLRNFMNKGKRTYMNNKTMNFQTFKLVLEKVNCQHPLDHRKSKRVPEKHLFLLYWLCQSLWLCGSHKLWKILKEMGIPDPLTCLLRNLYAGQEATVRTGQGWTGWFQVGKGVHQGCILSPCLFNLYADYIMRNAGLEETQAGIKIARRNISNLRYADDTTLMAESKEELKTSWWKWKRRVKKLA